MSDANVLECDVEFGCALEQVGTDTVGDCFTLCDELCRIELSDNSFEDLVSDGREDTLVVILTEILQTVLASYQISISLSIAFSLGRSWAAAGPLDDVAHAESS